jgi:UDP-2,4-diacetamido-2,4,6-trideoxy-beta-L-altropyranose hydrolase
VTESNWFVFRVDSSNIIGTGHVIRCLTLAEKLREFGFGSVFVCKDQPGNISNLIKEKGFELEILPELNSKKPLGNEKPSVENYLSDAEKTLQVIKGKVGLASWLIVDHYNFGQEWEIKVAEVANGVMVIDDLANRKHRCDILLDQNLAALSPGRYENLIPSYCKQLLGPKYALLQSHYGPLRKATSRLRKPVGKILVSLGGSDPDNLTRTVANLILECITEVQLDLVVGPAFAHSDSIRREFSKNPFVIIHEGLTTLAPLMAETDLMVGTGGTSSWERLALSVPSVTLVVADNQRENGEWLEKLKLAKVIDCIKKFDPTMFRDALNAILNGTESLETISEVDGNGAERVARSLLIKGVKARKATSYDAKLLFEWANELGVRSASLNQDPIQWEAHENWLTEKLENEKECYFLIVENLEGKPVGTVRFDGNHGNWKVNFSISKEWRGKGLGSKVLRVAIHHLLIERKCKTIIAIVKNDNFASLRVFEKLGFSNEVSGDNQLVFFKFIPKNPRIKRA